MITTAPAYNQWAGWNLSANWWFYEPLFRGYRPEVSSPSTVTWQRSTPVDWPEVPCAAKGGGVEVTAAQGPGLYELTVAYEGPGRGARAFTMLRNGINRAADGDGYVALDPGAAEQTLPAYLPASGTNSLTVRDMPGDRGELTRFTGCTARHIRVPEGADTLRLYAPLIEPG